MLDVEEFSCLAEAQVVIGDWREDYNHRRPHSSLGMLTPVAFAAEHSIELATLGPLADCDPVEVTDVRPRDPRWAAGRARPRPSPLRHSLCSRLRDDGRD